MAIKAPGKRPAKRFLKSKLMSGKFMKGKKSGNAKSVYLDLGLYQTLLRPAGTDEVGRGRTSLLRRD